MKVHANAKINLTLEVYPTRADGYHALRSYVQPIALADELDIELTADGTVSTDTGYGEKDLIVRAARLLGVGARVRVTKRIPAGGGLGGGSADAAATLLALNTLAQLGKTPDELAALGAAIGSDVPALVLAQHGRCPVLMEGRGERVSRVEKLPFVRPPHVVLANPRLAVSTAEVYARCVPRTEPTDEIVNDLQAAACQLHPPIATLLAAMKVAGAQDVMMTGSGSTVYGFASNESAAQAIAAVIGQLGCQTWVTRML